eukprot:UN34110
MGAEVWKIENVITGDETRGWGPPFINNESAYFLSVNRNKKSICIDLKSTEGINLIQKMVSKVDVVVENFIPGKTTDLGIDYDQLKKYNDKLIYCSVSGYGAEGPYAQRAGYDTIITAEGGLMNMTGEKGGSPGCKVGIAMTDMSTGLYAHGAILSSLYLREKTGVGQKIDCSLFETLLASLANAGSAYLIGGLEQRRLGTEHESIVPYQAFPCKDDKYVVVGAGNTNSFKRLCKGMNLELIGNDKKYSTNELRVKNRDKLINILTDRF